MMVMRVGYEGIIVLHEGVGEGRLRVQILRNP